MDHLAETAADFRRRSAACGRRSGGPAGAVPPDGDRSRPDAGPYAGGILRRRQAHEDEPSEQSGLDHRRNDEHSRPGHSDPGGRHGGRRLGICRDLPHCPHQRGPEQPVHIAVILVNNKFLLKKPHFSAVFCIFRKKRVHFEKLNLTDA